MPIVSGISSPRKLAMRTKFNVVNDDIMKVPSDLLLLKHADGFYGADEAVAEILLNTKKCSKKELNLKPNSHVIIETRGAIAPSHVMFLGTSALAEFGYDEMRDFASHAIEVLTKQDFNVRRLTTTIHGAGYGLDAEESLLNLVWGFESALAAHDNLTVREICFVEQSVRRADLLAAALRHRTTSILPSPAPDTGQTSDAVFLPEFVASTLTRDSEATVPPNANTQSTQKRHVFVAMPFSEDFEDVYEFGIYTPVRNCGLICEKTNETAYTGDILQRIRERIESANLVVADLTGARPNVYLEVGYAWGKGVPVIFVAREGEQLHFDVSRHRCIYYKSIRQLGRELDKLIRGILKIEERLSG